MFLTQWAQRESAAESRLLPEISSNLGGFLKINDRGLRLTSGHLFFTLNLPAPVMILYAV